MFETYTTVTGRVVSEPRRHQTAAHGEVVSLRVACNARRPDPQTQEWVNVSTLFLTVSCWRKLAAGVAENVHAGTSIIAHGTLRTNEYVGNDGVKRSDLEMIAISVGVDLGVVARSEQGAEALTQESSVATMEGQEATGVFAIAESSDGTAA